jgi:adenylate cyclase
MSLKGFANAEVEAVYAPARLLCREQGDSIPHFKVCWSLALNYLFRADFSAALEAAADLLPMAERLGDVTLTMEAHRALGMIKVTLGKFSEALDHLNQAVALYESARHDPHFLLTGNDAKVMSLGFAASALWALGYAEQALEKVNQALAFAQQLSHSESLIAALALAITTHQFRREVAFVEKDAEAVIALAQKQGLQMWKAFGMVFRGWSQVAQGQMEKGSEQLVAGLAAYEATGAKLWSTQFLGLLAEALTEAERLDDGLKIVDEALEATERLGERFYEAELLRLKGELLIHQSAMNSQFESENLATRSPRFDPPQQAEACFNQALATAREQQAKGWELKAALSLCRLYKRRNQLAEARELLSEISHQFSEGRETDDLREARAFLDS